jgi:hypothetical protein
MTPEAIAREKIDECSLRLVGRSKIATSSTAMRRSVLQCASFRCPPDHATIFSLSTATRLVS